MSDGIRRTAAILVVVAATALLWLAKPSTNDAEAAKNELDASVAYARERAAANDPRLKGAYRYERGGWVYVHLEGDPATIGYRHGYMLAKEIEDAFPAVKAGMTYPTGRDWDFFRQTAKEILWPNIDQEYQQELQGIADGLKARAGSTLDVYDIVAFNAFEELPDYYVPWLNKHDKVAHA